jgi:hypothetical protein
MTIEQSLYEHAMNRSYMIPTCPSQSVQQSTTYKQAQQQSYKQAQYVTTL